MTRRLRSALLALLVATAPVESADPQPQVFHLDVVRPGRARGINLTRTGTETLKDEQAAEAAALLEAALREDPLNVAAWINLTAARIKLCRRERALFSAYVAQVLDHGGEITTANLQLATRLQCPPEALAEDPVGSAEWSAYEDRDQAGGWIRAAAARRDAGDRALAALYEDFALRRGAETAPALRRIAADLEALGLLRAAMATLRETGAEQDAARAQIIEERLTLVAAQAAEIGAAIARRAGLRRPEELDGAARLAEVLIAAGADAATASRQLEELLGMGRPVKVSGWWGELLLDPEWTTVRLPEERGGPDLVLRKFPWDTQLAFFGWTSSSPGEDLTATLTRRMSTMAVTSVGPLAPCSRPPAGSLCLSATLEADVGFEGRGRLDAFLVGPAGGAPVLLLVALAGSAGCGAPCREAARATLEDIVASLQLAPGAAAPKSADPDLVRVPVPSAWQADRPHRENEDPWRRISLGDGLVADIPPGVTAGAGVGPFTDRDGEEIVIGDADWWGWIDVAPGRGGAVDIARRSPETLLPREDPEATFVKLADLRPVLAIEGRADDGVIARFDGRAFPGVWLVMRCRVDKDLVDVVIPILRGKKAASLSFIAITLRREGEPPPPPPVDLTARYQVRLKRGAPNETRTDPREGTLEAADIEFAAPRGYRVSLNPASRDGFPVTLRGDDGGVIVAERLAPAAGATPAVRRRQTEALAGAPALPWRSGRKLRGASQEDADFGPAQPGQGGRMVIVVVPQRPERESAYRITLTRGPKTDDEQWQWIRRLVTQSLRYTPPPAK